MQKKTCKALTRKMKVCAAALAISLLFPCAGGEADVWAAEDGTGQEYVTDQGTEEEMPGDRGEEERPEEVETENASDGIGGSILYGEENGEVSEER